MLTASIRSCTVVNYTNILSAIMVIESIKTKPNYTNLRIRTGVQTYRGWVPRQVE